AVGGDEFAAGLHDPSTGIRRAVETHQQSTATGSKKLEPPRTPVAHRCRVHPRLLRVRSRIPGLSRPEYRRSRQACGLGHSSAEPRCKPPHHTKTHMTIGIYDGCPGPGYWERDNSHFPLPMSRHLWELFVPAYDAGTRIGLS